MSTVDTSMWNPDADLNVEIEGIPLNADAGIAQTWQALRVLMAAVKGDGDAIKAMIDVMQGATASADGASGLVPQPLAGDQNKVLKGDGTWGSVPSPNLSTASRAVQTDTNGALAASSVTATELGHLSGVTSAVQTQLNAKAADADVVHLAGDETITDMKTIQGKSIGWSISYGNYTVRFMVGGAGVNRGLWDVALQKWLVYADASDIYLNGNAQTATKLATARKLKTDLSSSTDATFDGSANQESIPVTGILPVANGGTGSSAKNFVDLSTAQTVGGEKTFTTSVKIQRENPYLFFVETDWEKGTPQSSGTSYQGIYFLDKNSASAACFLYHFTQSKSSYLEISAYDMSSASASGGATVYLEAGINGANKHFRPSADNAIALGKSSEKWKEVWCSQSSINSSSDERIKSSIGSVPDEVLDAWASIEWLQYKFIDAEQEKGENARYHTGTIAQRVDGAFRNKGLDASRYGLFLHDEWNETPEEKDDEGNIVQPHRPAGDAYGLRYVEALCMEAAYQRRRADRLEKRLSEIEAKLSQLLNEAPESGEGEN